MLKKSYFKARGRQAKACPTTPNQAFARPRRTCFSLSKAFFSTLFSPQSPSSQIRQTESQPSNHCISWYMPRRRLPHLYPSDGWLLVTWHLHGSLPSALYPPPGKPSAGKAFLWMDRYLDTARQGPMFLRRPEVAGLVADALRSGVEMGYYNLRAFVVMGNHVHVLLRPRQQVSRLLQWLKGHREQPGTGGPCVRSFPVPVVQRGQWDMTPVLFRGALRATRRESYPTASSSPASPQRRPLTDGSMARSRPVSTPPAPTSMKRVTPCATR